MLRQLEQIHYVKDLVKRLSRNRDLRQVCGYQARVCEIVIKVQDYVKESLRSHIFAGMQHVGILAV